MIEWSVAVVVGKGRAVSSLLLAGIGSGKHSTRSIASRCLRAGGRARSDLWLACSRGRSSVVGLAVDAEEEECRQSVACEKASWVVVEASIPILSRQSQSPLYPRIKVDLLGNINVTYNPDITYIKSTMGRYFRRDFYHNLFISIYHIYRVSIYVFSDFWRILRSPRCFLIDKPVERDIYSISIHYAMII
jgi:hypothetical protein